VAAYSCTPLTSVRALVVVTSHSSASALPPRQTIHPAGTRSTRRIMPLPGNAICTPSAVHSVVSMRMSTPGAGALDVVTGVGSWAPTGGGCGPRTVPVVHPAAVSSAAVRTRTLRAAMILGRGERYQWLSALGCRPLVVGPWLSALGCQLCPPGRV